MSVPPKIITIEEHFTSPELRALRGEKDTPVQRKLDDLGALRIAAMDEAGIDLQIISENNPATRCTKPCARIPTASPDSRPCRRPIRKRRPTNWNAPWSSLASKAP